MKSVIHTGAFEMAFPIADLFPLFSPEGEKKWVPDWDYENVMGTIELSEDCVFLTKNHDHKTTEAIWIVKKYDPQLYFVQFYKIEPKPHPLLRGETSQIIFLTGRTFGN